ncbi:MAG: caspase family protein [Cyanobacteria bacterium P01_E01_bin.6]
MKRRYFLQFAASTLTTLGMNSLQLKHQGIQYAKVLAQPTRRKRAVLVGINEYSTSALFTNLKGCVTDVELQRELLIHRFGFHADDIVTLKDEQASRSHILECFEEFLINPCQDDDVVVFHYSGHGRRIADLDNPVRTETGETDRLNSTLVTSDDGAIGDGRTVSDIMGRTLFLLTSALKTENVTMVLDSCYAGGGIRGNTRVRSAGEGFNLRPSDEAIAYQERWLRDPRVGASREEILQRRGIGIAKGIAIASARRNQKAVDAQFDGFHAGAFTYFLTQYLWHEAESVESAIANVTRNLDTAQFNQVPLGCVAPLSCDTTQRSDRRDSQPVPIYHLDAQESDRAPAEAVIQGVNGDRATIWLGGSDANSLITYRPGAKFRPAGAPGSDPVTILSRHGLTAEVRLPDGLAEGTLQEGTLLQESSRIVPRDTTLRIGLDPSLAEEAFTAQAAFAELGTRFELVLPTEEGDYEGETHYILSRMTEEYRQFLQDEARDGETDRDTDGYADLPDENAIVLLSSGIDQVVPGSAQGFDRNGNTPSIDTVIDHLRSTFSALYAARFIKLAINADMTQRSEPSTPRLTIEVRVELLQNLEPVGEPTVVDGVMEMPFGGDYQFVVTNHEPEPLYLSILDIDEGGTVDLLLPSSSSTSVDQTLLQSGIPTIIPDNVVFYIQRRIRSEFLFMVSRRSPRQALIALRNERRTSTVPVVDALLADISGVEISRSTAEPLSMSTSEFTAFSIPYRVVG